MRAASLSPLTEGPPSSELADADELRYREEVEAAGDVVEAVRRKELEAKLAYALGRAGIAPRGVIVELGAGSCWLAAVLARRPDVERVVAVEFSRRRLEQLAPQAIAHLGAPPQKVHRLLSDFYNPGIEPGTADYVFCDAAFHHAADPDRLARVAWEILAPGGAFVLFREPSLALLRRRRDHGVEDEHGSFEREYQPGGYLRILRAAGFQASKHPASGGFTGARARAVLRPPLSWMNGIIFSEFTYVGHKPEEGRA